jgi:hypothetical protein
MNGWKAKLQRSSAGEQRWGCSSPPNDDADVCGRANSILFIIIDAALVIFYPDSMDQYLLPYFYPIILVREENSTVLHSRD